MQEPATAPWGLSISEADFKKLKAGFQPQDQDDKWRVTVDQGASGDVSIHVARTFSGKEFFVLHVKSSEMNSSGGARVESISWEQNIVGDRVSEEQAKKDAVSMARGLLGCDFDALP